MIIYYDHRCGKLIYRVYIKGEPQEFLTFEAALLAKVATFQLAV